MGKKSKGTNYTSKGERRNVSKKNAPSRNDVSYLERSMMAMKSWEKGSPCPKIIQRSMGIGPKSLYKNYVKSGVLGGK